MSQTTVLCADEDDATRAETVSAISAAGMDAVGVSDVATATARIEDGDIDCVVTEYDFSDGTGLDLLATVRATAPDTPCILYTDRHPADIETDEFQGVVAEYLPKGSEGAAARLAELIEEMLTLRSQVGYPLPDDEDERLAALDRYDLADEEIGPAFDRLTELARTHFEVDVAFIGIVGEHEERFLSCRGDDYEQLDRENTMCTHAILEEDVMLVSDVQADPRFEHNEALDELNIRSYAGAPMRTPDGAAIGSFCLTHDEPRTFSEADARYLRLLADEVMDQLELRRRLAEAEAGVESGDESVVAGTTTEDRP
ncbi:GAF domain-containing protein [Halorientalis marina]|jgi:CheY-like chemotaxis protein|uniref:GAF domain-containing protein n=1 Tax=Halorientalis marina TaxID=2931976 RepID=UPI001FF34251|nr:GAF domain-containing protein [Halorientalis marina]